MNDIQQPHVSVLLDEVLAHLLPEGRSIQRAIDGTLGAGGHTLAFLEQGVDEVLAFDLDPVALKLGRERVADYAGRAHLVHSSYENMVEVAHERGWQSVDAILLDLGVSSMQLDMPERGFAFRFENSPLDMRFNPQDNRPTAADLVNTWDASELADIFYRYGEEQNSRRLAAAIVHDRVEKPFVTTRDLAGLIERITPRRYDDRIHPATRVFQALRIAVNDELGVIAEVLPKAISLLKSGGRLAVISFHSLEDRIVKDAFRLASTDCICPPQIPVCRCGHTASVRLVNKKPIIAGEAEIASNPRSRSAKLRIVEKL